MTANRRIFLNVIATYGRSLFSLVCGLLSVRWVLMALGQSDFGLYGLIGSLTIFITFFNNQFSGALSRFYAYTIGKCSVAQDKSSSLGECRDWFTTGVLIHTVLPTLLISIGYPVGCYGITHGWFVIPADRIDACVWLWRFVCLSCFVAMINVPFNAMYIAKQYIAELTIYSFAQTAVKTAFIYSMTLVEREWLVTYGAVLCLVAIVPQFLICIRAVKVFPECRFARVTHANLIKIKELASYAWWQTFGGIGYLCRHQCLEVMANHFFGPIANASYTIGAHVGAESAILTGALNGAFTPAIVTSYGAGDMKTFRAMAFRSCKFGLLLTIIFAIPMCLEIDQLLILWLKTPPDYAKGFCLIWLIVMILEKIYAGHMIAVNASGRVALFQALHSITCILGLPVGISLCIIYKNVYMVGAALLVSTLLSGASDVIIAKRVVGLEYGYLVKSVISPSVLTIALSSGVGILVGYLLPQSLMRIIVTTVCVELVILPMSYFVMLDALERGYVYSKARNAIMKILRRY